jgi:hypothetical protein
MSDDIIDQLSYYVANEMRMPSGLTITVINYIEAQQVEIERLRNALKDERELRLNAETRAMARIADIDIRDAHIRYLKSAITNKEEQQ